MGFGALIASPVGSSAAAFAPLANGLGSAMLAMLPCPCGKAAHARIPLLDSMERSWMGAGD
jgi:hypothetical protein